MCMHFFAFTKNDADEVRIGDWSSDVCSSDLEFNDRHYLIVDGVDGRAHYVDIGRADTTEPLPDGAIIAIAPKRAAPRDVDRTIAEIAAANDGQYSVDIHLRHDPTATAAFPETHVRRPQAMRRRDIGLDRPPGGHWTPAPFPFEPAGAAPRDVDRTIAEIAAANDGQYSVDIHLRHDPTATAAFAETHVRRLEAMRRRDIGVDRQPDGTWTIAPYHLDRAVAYERSRARASPVIVAMLSAVALDRQVGADGATWLDRELLADTPTSLRDAGFGRSEEHTSEIQSLMRRSYAVFCLKKKNTYNNSMQQR